MMDEDEDGGSEKKYRKCEKAGCTATCPVCFASTSERSVQMTSLGLIFLPMRAFFVRTSTSKIVSLKIDINTVSHLIIETLPVHSVHTTPSYMILLWT